MLRIVLLYSSSFFATFMSLKIADAAAQDEPPRITVRYHFDHFAWLKPQTIPFEIINVVFPACSWSPLAITPYF